MTTLKLLPPLFIAVLCLGACAEREPVLRVACNIWVGYEPLYVAEALDYYQGSGIRMVDTTSATLTLSHLRHRTVEAACLTLDEVLTLVAEGMELAVVVVLDVSEGADVIMAKPPITKLGQLKGKTVAVEKSAVGAVILHEALHKAGLDPDDVVTLTVPVNQHQTAYREGRVDAVVTFEPVKSALDAMGATTVFSSAEIPGRIIDVLVVRKDIVAARREGIRRLVQGHFHALEAIKQDPHTTLGIMSRRLGTPPERVLALFEGLRQPDIEENRKLLSGTPAPFDEKAMALAGFLAERGLLTIAQPITSLSDGSFLTD